MTQDLTIDRGDITWMGVSLDYWADSSGWPDPYMTGFFELFVSDGDPDNGGEYLWSKKFDAIDSDESWFSSGLVSVDPSSFSLPNLSIWSGLRVTQLEWYQPDIVPQGRLDNLVIYIKAKATPENINLEMNGQAVSNVIDGGNPVHGLGTISYSPPNPWSQGAAYANFSWNPSPDPPDPNFDINVQLDASVTAYARRYNVSTIYDAEDFLVGDSYSVENASNVRWQTNFYAAVPGGYSSKYFFNISLPQNRDIDYVAQPTDRTTNLTYGWNYGDPGDGLVNVSAHEITIDQQNGFWLLKGSSPNMIQNLEVWNQDLSQWSRTEVFRANNDSRFKATLPAAYQNDIVNFTVYAPNGSVWTNLQATVDSNGEAITDFINFDAYNASVGTWEVQAEVADSISGGVTRNVGFYRRQFSIQHSTDISVKYPLGSQSSWSKNVSYGDPVLLQFRIKDADNGELLPGGEMTYSWAVGPGVLNDMGTGEYSVTLNTSKVTDRDAYPVSLEWTDDYYDPITTTFTINVIFDTELLSPDAPGIDIPGGYDGEIELYFEDEESNPITDASIIANWSHDGYSVEEVVDSPGYYRLTLETDNTPLDTYRLEINASQDYCESRTIVLSVQVRELLTSAIPSTSKVSLPVGYQSSFTITYRDTDHDQPITGAADAISCNWSDIHSSGEENYTVVEISPGEYEVTLFSEDSDVLDTYDVVFDIRRYATQNHTFTLAVELRTHLTSFYLDNPIEPTPYTGDIEAYVVYYDIDADTGITNGSATGYNVLLEVKSSTLLSVDFSVSNGSQAGEYTILIAADQWGSTGEKDLTILVNWTGPTRKYYNRTIETDVTIVGTPTNIYLGQSPVMTPYGENISFTVVYYDLANDTGISNSTGLYPDNVYLNVEVLTSGETLSQNDMFINESDPVGSPGEYLIEFNTSHLSGLGSYDLMIWLNWTSGQLPLYENQSLTVSVHATYRQSTVDWQPLPVTPYDELVNLTVVYTDVLSGEPILNSSALSVSIRESILYSVFYAGDASGEFIIELNTSSWEPGSHNFHLNFTWIGEPFYQNRTSSEIPITVRYRYTELVHGSYGPIQYGNNLTLVFTFRDLDDYSTSGMEGSILALNSSLIGYYEIIDQGTGNYTLRLNTTAFAALGTYQVNANITYRGTRFCENATDYFYLKITRRMTQLTSELPSLAPYQTLANITVAYTDDNDGAGVPSADVYATCDTAQNELELGTNYWIEDHGDGNYTISISTDQALGDFGTYSISVIVNWTGSPYYLGRSTSVSLEVSRRPISFTVSESPLSTAYLENVSFEITVTDSISGEGVNASKDVLIIHHGVDTLLEDSEYDISGDDGVYIISINSSKLSQSLTDDYPIELRFHWGDVTPFYANATTSTEVSITARFTQMGVLSTPPAYMFFNASATIRYSDYLSGEGIGGADISVSSQNVTSFEYWVYDLADGSYEIRVNTTGLSGLGTYYFKANATWTGIPYYQNRTGLSFSITVNPVSTSLKFELPASPTYYPGDQIVGNISFVDIVTSTGIEDASVQTGWGDSYGTSYEISEIGNGIYNLSINTTGLDAGWYDFEINASKIFHVNQSIQAEILLSAFPVEIQIEISPETPEWGDVFNVTVNVTDLQNYDPVSDATVNVTFSGDIFLADEVANGIYNCTFNSTDYTAGQYTITVAFEKFNYETREKDAQIKIAKLASTLSAAVVLEPGQSTVVNGENVTVRANYTLQGETTPITDGSVTYDWIGGTGSLSWDTEQASYTGVFTVSGVPIGSHQFLLRATSSNYKSVNTQLLIEVKQISTELAPFGNETVLSVISGDQVNVTVYLNNTDLGIAVSGANLTFSIGSVTGNLPDIGDGYYSGNVSTEILQIREWTLSVSSFKDGYESSVIRFTVEVEKIPTRIAVVGDAFQEAFYGQNVTYNLTFSDSHNNVGIVNASTSYSFASSSGTLIDEGDGEYSLIVNTTTVSAGSLPHTISITFSKERYSYAYGNVRILVKPIPTQILGSEEVDFPVGDDYSQFFGFRDTLHNKSVMDATATAIWEFGTVQLTNLNNGSYRFGPAETNDSRLQIRSEPYRIRIVFSRGNYSQAVLLVDLTIRPIKTEVIIENDLNQVYVGEPFLLVVTFLDIDHGVPIANAANDTPSLQLTRSPDIDIDYGNGTYAFGFVANNVRKYQINVTLSASDYEDGEVSITIYSLLTPEQEALVTGFSYGMVGLIALVILGALYVKVLSVPKMLRWLRSMVGRLEKGEVPEAKPVRSRREVLMEMMNEDLESVHIRKTTNDVAPSTVDVSVLDIEELLDELAKIVGLTEDDVALLRDDLEAMRPSERPGFVSEVIRQEKARRAREIKKKARKAEEPEIERGLSEAELDDLRRRLEARGMESSEVDLIVEQARNLSRAEIDALLDQLGGDEQ
ncbi:MAG: hypothetical protein R6V83_13555 [Candidatus Thorarchaeota archaeon]